MNKKRIFFASGFVSAVLAATIITVSLNAKNNDDASVRVEALSKLTKTISTVEKYYVDDMKFKEIVDKAIEGLLNNLDAHSGYLNEKAFKDMQVQTSGEFGGLGITVGIRDGALTVIAPIEGTPADKAGVKSGDIILRIDGNATLGTTIEEAVNKMRGKPKTPITITIVRKGEPKPFDLKLIRDIISVESVYAKMIENEDILYLRVTNFDKQVTQKAEELIKKYPKAQGIILDLRNNPGGLLNQAVGLTNLFIDSGVIVSQKGRNESENSEFKASKGKKITNLPLVVLVNGGSASASEIVSGSLQDHKRAVVVGENTFGKGSVQIILPVDDKEAIRLTIARYYLPSGRTIQAVGVTPDITVFPGKVPQDSVNSFSIKESELKKHLENELTKISDGKSDANSTVKKDDEKEDKTILTKEKVNDDMQLKSAIDAIKVLKIK